MHIDVSLAHQLLRLYDDHGDLLMEAPVSSSANGPGEAFGSERTPRGQHVIRAKIGDGLPQNSVLVRRRPTGEIYTPQLARDNPGRDWILSRILWLSGKEPGRNSLGEVDSMRRFIYIHGTPDSEPMGKPASHGCLRMRNADVIRLFDLTPVGTTVNIA